MAEIIDRRVNIDLTEAAKAHTYYLMVSNFVKSINSTNLAEQTKVVLNKLCILFAVGHILELPAGLIESGYVK